MKKSITLFLMLCALSFSVLQAQDYKISVQNSNDGKLVLTNFPQDLPVEGYSGNEIIITSDKEEAPPERAKGLKAVYADGSDNTGVAVHMEKNGNQVTLKCLLPITKSASYKIKVPDNFSIEINNECGNSGDVSISNVKGEVAVKNCGAINLKNISGPVVLSTISGDMNITLSNLPKDRSISLASISGEIDLTVPSNAGMNVEMQNISGSIYTDFELASDDKQMKHVGGNSVKAQLNGGGASVKITNVSGNIYLRKGK